MNSVLVLDAIAHVMAKDGLHPESVLPDGIVHRFSVDGHKRRNGWYLFKIEDDGHIHGAYGDWKQGLKRTFNSRTYGQGGDTKVNDAAKAALLQQAKEAEARRIKEREEAKAKVERINAKMGNSGATQYTKRKHVEVHHPAKAIDGTLFIPLFCADNIVNYQMIFSDGTKRFLKGGQTMGCYCVLDCDGYERENIVDANIIFIAEGYATAASLFYWLGVPTVIAFSASNLTATSIALRDKYPTKRIIVCGDTGSDGVKYGEQAARMGNAELKTCPPLQHGSDYNDAYFQLHPDKIRAHILGGDYA